MKIKAAIVFEQALPRPYAKSRAVTVDEVEIAGPGDTEILVRIVAAGVCHSDLSVVNGNRHDRYRWCLGMKELASSRKLAS